MAEREWVRAFPVAELPVGECRLVRERGCHIAVFRVGEGTLHAVDNRCPHEGYPLHQGWVSEGVVTCPWHNFKFDLKSGACVMGDEAVRVFPLRLREDHVELDVTPPDPATEIPRLMASLERGMLERKLGQMARDVVRLIDVGVSSERIALEVARLDASYADYGTTHVLPVAVDALAIARRYEAHCAVLPLMQPLDLAAATHTRRPRRAMPAPAPVDDVPAAGRGLMDLVEAERADEAIALFRGALRAGAPRGTVEPWFFALCAEHFLDFGHALIYTVKAFDLLAQVGWEHADDLLPALLLRIVSGTREELVPEWAWFRRAAEEVAPRLPAIAAREQRDRDTAALFEALCDADRKDAVSALIAALEQGASDDAVVDAISAAAAERLLRFDLDIDTDPTVQDGWLDVTHTLTFAAAVRVTLSRWREPQAYRLVLYAARFANNTRPLDMPVERRFSLEPRDPTGDPVAAITSAIAEKRAQDAIAFTAGYLRSGLPLAPLRAALEDLALGDALTRPLVVAHAIKTCIAAFDEHAAMSREGAALRALSGRPLLAAVRLLASPVRERRVASSAHDAIRFVVEGKVPRYLTG